MLLENDTRSYTPKDLEVFNLLKHPVWVFDFERKAMYWANKAALEVWNADSLESLLNRDFKSDMSEAAEVRMKDVLVRLSRGEILTEQWTFYSGGRPKTVSLTSSGIRIDGGRIAGLGEAELPDKEAFHEGTVRGVGMLRYLPFAVTQFSMEGNLVFQNPAAMSFFGTPPATENPQDHFLRRFVDQELGKSALKQVQEGNNYSSEMELYTQLGPRCFQSTSEG
jgi:hypothetical protein